MTPSNTTGKRWSWSTGERGINRVRVFTDAKTNNLFLEWREGGKPRTEALGHQHQELAKQAAEAKAAIRRRKTAITSGEALTLGELVDIYLEVRSPELTDHNHHVRTAALFLVLWGRGRRVMTLSEADVEEYVTQRRAGALAPAGRSGKTVRNRTLEQDVVFLRTLLNWAAKTRNDAGEYFIPHNPIRDFDPPKEQQVRRPRLGDGEYEKLLAKAKAVDPRFYTALVLAHDTGHRLNSVRHLRWEDFDWKAGTVTWQAEFEKESFTHVTPLTEDCIAALQLLGVKDRGWVFPSKRVADQPMGRNAFIRWWWAGTEAAKLPDRGGAWHMLRRQFASELIDLPLAMVAELGGWKDPTTPMRIYQKASIDSLRDAMKKRGRSVFTPSPTPSPV